MANFMYMFNWMFSHQWAHRAMLKASELACAAFSYMWQHQHMMQLGKAMRKGVLGV